jgi:hypothetical protein
MTDRKTATVIPAPSAIHDKLASFYLWCADHHDILEVKSLAETISKWQQPVIDAVLTGYSNAKAEAHNRTAKMVARTARGFASLGTQARRVRMATTQTARQAPQRRSRRRSREVARGRSGPGLLGCPGTGTAPAVPRLSTETPFGHRTHDSRHPHGAGVPNLLKAEASRSGSSANAMLVFRRTAEYRRLR